MPRTRACTQEVRRGRLRKAGQFLDAASPVRDLADEDGEIADVYVTLCVHAGIAASDGRLQPHAGDGRRVQEGRPGCRGTRRDGPARARRYGAVKRKACDRSCFPDVDRCSLLVTGVCVTSVRPAGSTWGEAGGLTGRGIAPGDPPRNPRLR